MLRPSFKNISLLFLLRIGLYSLDQKAGCRVQAEPRLRCLHCNVWQQWVVQ